MLRFKVVGRREEPITRMVQGAPGMPQQTEQATQAQLLLQAVDSDGAAVGAPNPTTIVATAASFDELSDYTTGEIYELREG